MTITGTLTITVVGNTPVPPPAGQAFLEFTPNPVTLQAGKSTVVSLKVNDGKGNLSVPTGVLVPYWTGQNNGIQVTVLAVDSLKIDVPLGAALGSFSLTVELR